MEGNHFANDLANLMLVATALVIVVRLALLGCARVERLSRARTAPARPRARQFPEWSEAVAQRFLAGGACKWR